MAERRPTSVEKKRTKKSTTNKSTKKSWLKKTVLAILLIGIIGLLSGLGLFAYYASTAPELDEELLKYPVSSEIYDANGELIAKIGAEKRTFVAYDEIPQEMIDAIIATEDVRFFDHFGLDIWRLGGAVVANLRDGFGAQGGSTITQQVVKNSFLKNEKKLKRKAQEAWLAIKLERAYSKEEIFEMYFNRILMSGTVYGFGTAAETFYGKELNELTLPEIAQLAGMPQSPNNYNPFKHPETAQKRRDIVLGLMVQHGKITKEEADEAKATNVADLVLPEEQRIANSGLKYPDFISVVYDELRENGDYDLLSEGIKVYTTLDPKAQDVVDSMIDNPENFPTEKIQAGIAVIDTKTGAIRAIGGGRDYGSDLGYNFANDMVGRSPGSTAKPLVSYGPAIEYLKWSTGETTEDVKMNYPNSNQQINNWDNKYNGVMTIRQALYTSRNVPAVTTLLAVGKDKSKEFLSNVGIEVDHLVDSSPLGPNIEVTPVKLASAYAAFGNNGVYTKGHAITKIVYRDGKTEKDYTPKPNIAMSDYTAYMITDILRNTVSNLPGASANYAIVNGVDVAGKTGTTNYSRDDFNNFNLPSSAVPDSWFVGYTTEYSIAIWAGYRDYKDPITTWPERRLPQTLFKGIMTKLTADGKPERFKKPSSVVEATIEVGTNPLKLASEFTPNELKRTELFVKGTEPTAVSEEYKAPEVGSVMNVKANLSEDAKTIDLTWEYVSENASENGENEIAPQFEVKVSIDGGEATVLTTTDKLSVKINSVEPNKTYTFTITPKINETIGTPGMTTILVNPVLEEPEEPDNNNNNNGNDSEGNQNGNQDNNNPDDPDENEEDVDQPNSGRRPPGPGQGPGSGPGSEQGRDGEE